ncbi:MAG TPA: redoxin domain-containing protein [Blastocatellia bacterium]|nr:redoxin domain-containing protein [Blastocatellia bacterium]
MPNIILTCAVFIALVFIGVLYRENNKLSVYNKMLAESKFENWPGLSGTPALQVDDIVPSFDTINLQQQFVKISYDNSSTYLFFIFSSRCGSCVKQLSNWNHIAAKAKVAGAIPIGIALDGSEALNVLRNDNWNFDTIAMPSMAVQRAYRVVAIPQIMLISPLGTVDWVHRGELTGREIDEVISRVAHLSRRNR